RALQVSHHEIQLIYGFIEAAQHVGIRATADDVAAQAVQSVFRKSELARERQHLIETRRIDAYRRVARYGYLIGATPARRRLFDRCVVARTPSQWACGIAGRSLRCRLRDGFVESLP